MARRSPLRAFAAFVVLSLTVAMTTPATAQPCDPGSFSATGSQPCTSCGVGTFQAASGASTCQSLSLIHN